ncbi:trypsin-like peptidase domain-containing protein, partial [Amycolatopsis lurida]|uniref:trypsin-like peptidase domain-containing protein n=1 Tax=Amycolatopsis lurida TaxID=31959 RepID=UPI00365705B5
MSGRRAALAAAARASTVPLTTPSGRTKGTGFHVTSTMLLTCAHVVTDAGRPVEYLEGPGGPFEVLRDWLLPGGPDGLDLALLRAPASSPDPPAYLSEATAPGDDLWVFGYPDGNYRAGDSVSIRYDGTSEHVAGPVLLKGTQGRIRPGMSGGPVLNWRTGAICGVVRYRDGTHDDTARFVPMSTIFQAYPGLSEANSAEAASWLRLLDDEQIDAAGACFPGPRMRRYLEAASTADEIHPYAAMLDVRAPLSKVYLRQEASRGEATEELAENTERIDGSVLLRRYEGAQILGGPGAGKSSLARYLTALSAQQWLDGTAAGGVPILITADALTQNEGLVEMLASGVVQTVDLDLDRPTLTSMFAKPPFPGAQWLVLVDGVDEILYPYLREAVLSKISRHRSEGRYRFLLTTRPLPAYLLNKVADGDRYPTFTIEPFGRHELKTFAAKWFTQLGLPDPRAAALDFDQRVAQVGIGHLATIPLIATMLCILYANAPDQRLPGNRAELYAEFVELLLTKRKILNVREMLTAWTSRSGPQAVAASEELIQRTPELLKIMAYQQHLAAIDPFRSGRKPDAVAVVTGVISKPSDLSSAEWASVIREVLRSCGLLVERRGDFHFLHQTVQEYLAAAYLAERHPDPRKRAARRQLVPRRWPRQDLEVMTFLAALWAKNGRDLHPVLKRLLGRKHSRDNHQLVLELHRQGILLPDRTTARLTDVLVRWLEDKGLSNHEWRTAAGALVEISPVRATTTFERIAGTGHSWQRRFDSATFLIGIRRDLGIQAFAVLANDRSVGGAERLKAAKRLHGYEPARSMAALAAIVNWAEPDNLRVEAALFVAEHDLRTGLRLLRTIAYSEHVEPATRLNAARHLARHDSAEALLVMSGSSTIPGEFRLDAATEAEQWAPDSARWQLIDITEKQELGVDVRFKAADHLAQHGDAAGLAGFRAVARTKSGDSAIRAKAAARLAETDFVDGLALQLDLVGDATMGEDRIAVGRSAGLGDPKAAARSLARLVGDHEAVQDRYGREFEENSAAFWAKAGLGAAELDREIGLGALEGLALDRQYSSVERTRAASAVAEVDRERGVALLRKLV